MWMLVIVMLTEMGTTTEYVVERYLTQKACGHEKIRIEIAMHQAYPDDHDFRLVCRKSWKIV